MANLLTNSSFNLQRLKSKIVSHKRAIIVGILLSTSFLYCHFLVFGELVRVWTSYRMYSYGLLIPFISLYMIWMNRRKISTVRRQASFWSGMLVTFAGLSMLYVGRVGDIQLIQEFSIIVTITGLIIYIGGKPLLRVLSFPVAYLVLMVPFWENVTEKISFPFQLFTARLGVSLLNQLRVPAVQYDQFIELPNITLEVAKACSGLDYLIAIVAIGIPLSIYYVSGFFRKVGVIFVAVLVAMLSNPLRVALIGAFSYHSIGNNFFGPFHLLQGFFVSIVGYVILFLAVSWLGSATSQRDLPTKVSSSSSSRDFYFLLPPVVTLLVFGYFIHTYEPHRVSLKANLDSIPREVDEWKMAGNSGDYFYKGGPDLELSRGYSDSQGNEAYIYIAYWEYQKQGKEFILSKTKTLYDNILTTEITTDDSNCTINKSLWKKNGNTITTYYWFSINDRVIKNRYIARLYTVLNSMLFKKSNGSLVIISFVDKNRTEPARKKSDEERFLKLIFPSINNFLSI